MEKMTVWILDTGDGYYSYAIAVYSTEKLAQAAEKKVNQEDPDYHTFITEHVVDE